LHQVGNLFELNVKLWCQKVNAAAEQHITCWAKGLTNIEECTVCLRTVLSKYLIQEEIKSQIFLPPSIYILNSQFILLFPSVNHYRNVALSRGREVEAQDRSDVPAGHS